MDKSRDAFRTISEVADWLDTPTHVLRFWESRFTQVKPVKRAGGRRYYRPSDMMLLGGIKKLLHEDGMTIRGVQKLLREQGVKHVSTLSQPIISSDDDVIDEVAIEVVDEAPMAVDVEETLADNVVPLAPAKPARRAAPKPAEDDMQAGFDFGLDVPLADEDDAAEVPHEEAPLSAALDDPSGFDADTAQPSGQDHGVTPEMLPPEDEADDALRLEAPLSPALDDAADFDVTEPAGAPDAIHPEDAPDDDTLEAPLSAALDDPDDTAAETPEAPDAIVPEDAEDAEDASHLEAPLSAALDDPSEATAIVQPDIPEDPEDDAEIGAGTEDVMALLRTGAARQAAASDLAGIYARLQALRDRM